jgi:hypothetical protein
VLEDASSHDVAAGGAMAERADDLATKMHDLIGHRVGERDAGNGK